MSIFNIVRLTDRPKKHFTKKGKKLMTPIRTKKIKARTDLIAKAKKARKGKK